MSIENREKIIEELLLEYDKIDLSNDTDGKIRAAIEDGKRFIREYAELDEDDGRKNFAFNRIRLNQLEIALLLLVQPKDKAIPADQLQDKLAEYGMLNIYTRWIDDLSKEGFEPKIITETMLEHGAINFCYHGNFSVEGDHAHDVFTIVTTMMKDKIIFNYASSLLDYHAECQEMLGYEFGETIKGYIKKIGDYLGYKADKIEVDYTPGCTNFNIIYGENEAPCVFHTIDIFSRLAILLDRELKKSMPFGTVSDHEERAQDELSRLSERTVSKNNGNCPYGIDGVTEILICSKFFESRNDCLSRIKEYKRSVEAIGGELYRIVSESVEAIAQMTEDEFYRKKLELFDIE